MRMYLIMIQLFHYKKKILYKYIMDQKIIYDSIFNEIDSKCCFTINEKEKVLIVNFIKKFLFIYIETSLKLAKHSCRNKINLSDIKLTEDLIDNDNIMVSTEINKEKSDKIANLKGGNHIINNSIDFKAINEKHIKFLVNLCLKNIQKSASINKEAINYLYNKIKNFLSIFLNQCQNFCKYKLKKNKNNKKVKLNDTDIYYILVNESR